MDTSDSTGIHYHEQYNLSGTTKLSKLRGSPLTPK